MAGDQNGGWGECLSSSSKIDKTGEKMCPLIGAKGFSLKVLPLEAGHFRK